MRLLGYLDISCGAGAGERVEKQAAPENDSRRGRSIGGIGINHRDEGGG